MMPDELREILALLGMAQGKLARKTGYSVSRVRKMARGHSPITPDIETWLRNAARREIAVEDRLSDEARRALGDLLG